MSKSKRNNVGDRMGPNNVLDALLSLDVKKFDTSISPYMIPSEALVLFGFVKGFESVTKNADDWIVRDGRIRDTKQWLLEEIREFTNEISADDINFRDACRELGDVIYVFLVHMRTTTTWGRITTFPGIMAKMFTLITEKWYKG